MMEKKIIRVNFLSIELIKGLKIMSSDYGIDYGNRKSNIDLKTGIRFGVIPCNTIDFLWDSLEAVYILECRSCGKEIEDDICPDCNTENNFEEIEPLSWKYEKNGYILTTGSDCIDIFVIKSPFYTYAKFCSPCAPGACYLPDFITDDKPDNNKCYCLDSEWFEQAPNYKIYTL
jgi:hypothetical protein